MCVCVLRGSKQNERYKDDVVPMAGRYIQKQVTDNYEVTGIILGHGLSGPVRLAGWAKKI